MNTPSQSDSNPTPAGASLRERFDQLLDVPEEARLNWLQTQVSDAQEREQLSRLLRASVQPGALDIPPMARIEQIGDAEFVVSQMVGRQIGAYVLRRLIGSGGMGVVFLAERVDDGQRVAIKLLHRGLFNVAEQRLFRRERQLLASLQHPNIAHLIDGGMTDPGIPYLVLEYVDGVPITDYAQSNKLDQRALLKLMATVCEAVAAAHRRLIVHRDLKPGNILIDQNGNPKLLDFGIAKLLDEDTDSTRTAIVAMTPEYAAPEQIAGEPVSMATDVYSLGVLLHELLLGQRPQQAEPATQSTGRALRGDLGNIVRMALSADPERRYASAAELGDDLERHLAALPVRAHPPSARYRVRKFVQRHRGGVVLGALFALGLVMGLGIAIWQAKIAQRESIRAQAQAARADSVRAFLEELFEPVERGLPQASQPTVVSLVASGVERLRQETDLPDAERIDLLLMFARLNDRIGELKVGRALGIEAAQLAEKTLEPVHPVRIESLVLRGAQAGNAGDYDLAEGDLSLALAQSRRSGVGGKPLISILDRLARVQMDRNDHPAVLRSAQEALDERRRTFGADAEQMGAGFNNLGYALVGAGRFAEAVKAYEKTYQIDAKYLAPGSLDLLGTLSNWGWALARAGQLNEARKLLARADVGLSQIGGKPRLMHVLNSQKLCRVDVLYDLAEAAQSCPRMLQTAREFSDGKGMFWGYALILEGTYRLENGELARAAALANAALQEHPADAAEHVRGRGGALQLRALSHWLQGDAANARDDALGALKLFANVGDSDIAAVNLLALLLRACDAAPASSCPPDLADTLKRDLLRLQSDIDPRLVAPRTWFSARAGDVAAVDAAIALASELPPTHPYRPVAQLWHALASAANGDCASAKRDHIAALRAHETNARSPWFNDALREWQQSACAE